MISKILELAKKLFFMPYAALAIIAVGLAAVIGAHVIQYFFDASPCILCIFQRVPYALLLLFGALAFFFRDKPLAVKILFGLSALALFINTGIAFYHSGVELHWWAGTDGCEVTPLANLSDPHALRLALLETAVSQCDEINFTFLGFSLANWNVLITLFWGTFSAIVALRDKVPFLKEA